MHLPNEMDVYYAEGEDEEETAALQQRAAALPPKTALTEWIAFIAKGGAPDDRDGPWRLMYTLLEEWHRVECRMTCERFVVVERPWHVVACVGHPGPARPGSLLPVRPNSSPPLACALGIFLACAPGLFLACAPGSSYLCGQSGFVVPQEHPTRKPYAHPIHHTMLT